MKTEKKIIGYKMTKPQYAKAACKIEGYRAFGESVETLPILFDGSEFEKSRRRAVEDLRAAGVLDLWFEPIYEEGRIVKVAYEEKGKFLEVEIVEQAFGRGKVAMLKGRGDKFTKKDLQFLLRLEIDLLNQHRTSIKFKPSYFNVGCNGQYKNVKAEDIQKVIDAL